MSPAVETKAATIHPQHPAVLPFQTHQPAAESPDAWFAGQQPQAVARALASIPHSRAMAMVSQLTIEEQFKLVQQLVNVRTLAPKAAVEFARQMQARQEASRAKAG